MKERTSCERCKDETHYLEYCNYCKRKICRNCQKSSLRASKTERKIICKDCWSNISKRKAFKSA